MGSLYPCRTAGPHLQTAEQKSVQWILPKVLETLEELKTCTPTPSAHVR